MSILAEVNSSPNNGGWRWLVDGQNAQALSVIVSAAAVVTSTVIAAFTLWIVRRQTVASEEQAKAAVAQVKASESSQAVSEALLEATKYAAQAEGRHGDLVSYQILEALRPVLVLKWDANGRGGFSGTSDCFLVENQGTGVAHNIRVEVSEVRSIDIQIGSTVIGSGFETQIWIPKYAIDACTIEVLYDSLDGRHFLTGAFLEGERLIQQVAEVNADRARIS
jgi:hypothetical protein